MTWHLDELKLLYTRLRVLPFPFVCIRDIRKTRMGPLFRLYILEYRHRRIQEAIAMPVVYGIVTRHYRAESSIQETVLGSTVRRAGKGPAT
jgi:hypothetical protein